jgi:hypothetical protein
MGDEPVVTQVEQRAIDGDGKKLCATVCADVGRQAGGVKIQCIKTSSASPAQKKHCLRGWEKVIDSLLSGGIDIPQPAAISRRWLHFPLSPICHCLTHAMAERYI